MRHKPQKELSSVSSWLPFFTAMLPRQTWSGSSPTPHMYFTKIAFLKHFLLVVR